MISLEAITRENIHAVLSLAVAESQRAFYPHPNAYSIAEGLFPPDDDSVWMAAICKDGVSVGFMMTSVVEEVEARLAEYPDAMRVRRATVEHPFGTLKAWMGSTHFLTKTLDRTSMEMSLHVLAYNMKRVISLIGTRKLLAAI